jgi:hypothetical protein
MVMQQTIRSIFKNIELFIRERFGASCATKTFFVENPTTSSHRRSIDRVFAV